MAQRAQGFVGRLLDDGFPPEERNGRVGAEPLVALHALHQRVLLHAGLLEHQLLLGVDDDLALAVEQEGGAGLARPEPFEALRQPPQRNLDAQYPFGVLRAGHRDRQHQARDRLARRVGQHVDRADGEAGMQRALQRHLGGIGRQPGLVDRLAGELFEADGVADSVGMRIEEADHVGAAGLAVDEEQRLLARLGVQFAEPQRGSRQRQRVELVDQRAVDFGGQRARVLRIDLVELVAQRFASLRQREGRRQQERKRGRRREE